MLAACVEGCCLSSADSFAAYEVLFFEHHSRPAVQDGARVVLAAAVEMSFVCVNVDEWFTTSAQELACRTEHPEDGRQQQSVSQSGRLLRFQQLGLCIIQLCSSWLAVMTSAPTAAAAKPGYSLEP